MPAEDADLGELVDGLAERLSNWGRWGADDELGTLNLITADRRAAAAACVRGGEVLSLALPLNSEWPQGDGSGRLNCRHLMVETGTDALAEGSEVGWADDMITMSVHAHTHWDAFSHVFHRGKMYNGRSAAEVSASGAAANDITPLAARLASRGVLIDLAPGGALPTDHEVTAAELEAALEGQEVEVETGDTLLVRTGRLGQVRATGEWRKFTDAYGVNPEEPGIGPAALPWLHERGVAAFACDNWAVEVLHGAGSSRMPVHELALVYMGMPIGEMFDLDRLATCCAADGHWDFLLSAAPLPIEGGVGGPVNPIAIR
ncbi:MAG: cyclase family protein [Solirubrobacterales bacterium]